MSMQTPYNEAVRECYICGAWYTGISHICSGAPPIHALPTAGEKPTNPKDVLGMKKLPLSMVPNTAIAEETLAMLDGACKYGRDNFRAIGVRASVYIDAALRHLKSYMEGEDVPPDSLATHLGHARACLGILIDAKWAGMLEDDRKIAGGYFRCIEELTPLVAKIQAKYEDKHPKHYTIADTVSE